MADEQEYPQDTELHRLVMSHLGNKYKVENVRGFYAAHKSVCLAMFDMHELAKTMAAVISFDGKEGDTLYWSVTPGCEHRGEWGWKAYMRYLVSGKRI